MEKGSGSKKPKRKKDEPSGSGIIIRTLRIIIGIRNEKA
jgi:hypothetical protein